MKIFTLILLFFLQCSDASKGILPLLGLGGASPGVEGGVSTSITENATLRSIQISPSSVELPKELEADFNATAIYSDGTKKDVTSEVQWTAQDTTILEANFSEVKGSKESQKKSITLSSKKKSIRARSPGETKLRASLEGITGEARVLITDESIQKIEFPKFDTIPTKQNINIHAGVILNSERVHPLAPHHLSISPLSTATAELDLSGNLVPLTPGDLILVANISGITASTTLKIIPDTIQSILVEGNETIIQGLKSPYRAFVIYESGKKFEITGQVTWTAEDSNGKLEKEGIPGLLEALSPGEITLRASFKDYKFSKKILITAPKIVSLSVSQDGNAPLGMDFSYRAIATFDDGSFQDVTSQVTWESENPAIVTISNGMDSSGTAVANSTGTSRITGSIGGISASAIFKSSPAQLKSVAISNPGSIALGLKNQLQAMAIYSDGSTKDVSSLAHWTVTGSGEIDTLLSMAGTFHATATGSSKILVSFGGLQSSTTITVTQAKLSSISVSPGDNTLPKGLHRNLSAWGVFSDGTKKDITRECNWTVDGNGDGIGDNLIGEIGNGMDTAGRFTALSEGNATIYAGLSGITGSLKISVNSPELLSISLEKPEFLVSGVGGKLRAVGLYSDGSTKDLTSELSYSITGSLFINPQNGLISSGIAGSASITASLGDKSVSFNLSVKPAILESISITPPTESIPKGVSQEIKAYGKYSDGTVSDLTNLVTWLTDSNGTLQKADGKVFFSGTGVGPAGIRAIYGGKEVVSTFPISPAILTSITLESPDSIASGLHIPLRAIGIYSDFSSRELTGDVSWSTTSGSIENSTAEAGKFQSGTVGTVTVNAKLGSIQISKSIQVLPPEISSLQFDTGNITLPSGTRKNVKIFATLTDGSTRDVTEDAQFIADSNGDNLNDENVISISNHRDTRGQFQAVSPGQAILRATINGKSITKTATITEAELVSINLGEPVSIPAGIPIVLKAIGTFTDNTTQDITNSASISLSGKGTLNPGYPGQILTGTPGNSLITVSYKGITSSLSISVLPPEIKSLTLSGANTILSKGTKGEIRITGILTDNSTTDLTSQASFFCDSNGDGISDTNIVSISNLPETKGQVEARGMGTASILITVGSKQISTSITVKAADLTSISINPPLESVPLGTEVQFTATGFYTDGSHQDITGSVNWTVVQGADSVNAVPDALLGNLSTNSIASIGTTSSPGKLTTLGTGDIRITATLNSISRSGVISILPAELRELLVQSENPTLPKGLKTKFTALGKYSDNTLRDLTPQVTWISDSNGDGLDDSIVLSISNEENKKGSSTAINTGSGVVRALFQGKEGSKSFTVLPAIATSLAISSVNSTRPKGLPETFLAMATYSDGQQVNVTSSITWIADSNGDGKNDTSVVSISNSIENRGQATTVNPGVVKIIGSLGALSTSINFTVLPAVLQTITIQPNSISLAKGFQRQFTANGKYSDGSEQDITKAVTWKSDSDNNAIDDALIASVSNAALKNGLVTGISAGTSKITAELSGITSNILSIQIIDSNTIGSGTDPKLQIQEIPAGSLPFTYQSTRNLGVQALVTDQNGNSVSGALVDFLNITESELLFGQISAPDGRVSGTVVVNNADTQIIARITTATGIQKITVPIQREIGGEIRLVVNILGIQIPTAGSPVSPLPDDDGDGVPDSRDAFLGDNTRSTKVRYPASGNYTITFEDKFPDKGDSDLNDYVVYAVFEEDLNARGEIVSLRGRFQHVARGSIDNLHYLNWRLPSSVNISKFSTEILNGSGSNTKKGKEFLSPESKTLPIFNELDSTQTLPWEWFGLIYRPVYNVYECPLGINCFEPGYVAKVSIDFVTPVKRDILGSAPYDVFLTVKSDTRTSEVHFPGLVFENNKDKYLDSGGFPWAILVPGEFKWPKLTIPTTTIYTAYPDFDKWAKSRGTKFQTWFNTPNINKVYTDGAPGSTITAK